MSLVTGQIQIQIDKEMLAEYVIRQADNCLILGQRLAEWCGHGPVLEQDIALTNIALDLIGQARNYYQYAVTLQGKGQTEDELALLREAKDYHNILLVELPNRDFAHTIVRQFLFDAFHYSFLGLLAESGDAGLLAIAKKSIKEVGYHLRFSSEWMIRLGDGTEESHRRMQEALENIWPYAGEMLEADSLDDQAEKAGWGVNLGIVAKSFHEHLSSVLQEAKLAQPEGRPFQKGGKHGRHAEHFDYLLAELQFMQRTWPGLEW